MKFLLPTKQEIIVNSKNCLMILDHIGESRHSRFAAT